MLVLPNSCGTSYSYVKLCNGGLIQFTKWLEGLKWQFVGSYIVYTDTLARRWTFKLNPNPHHLENQWRTKDHSFCLWPGFICKLIFLGVHDWDQLGIKFCLGAVRKWRHPFFGHFRHPPPPCHHVIFWYTPPPDDLIHVQDNHEHFWDKIKTRK